MERAKVLVALAALTVAWLGARPVEAFEATVVADDPALAAAVTDELQLWDEPGEPSEAPWLVALSSQDGLTVVQVQRPGDAGHAVLDIPLQSGMDETSTRALAIAEAVRSLVATGASSSPPPATPAPASPPPAPPIPAPAAPPVSEPATMTMAPLPPLNPGLGFPDMVHEREDGAQTHLRVGGVGGALFAAPMWYLATGFQVRGQVSPSFTLSAGLGYAVSLYDDDTSVELRVHRLQLPLGWAWEVLGADASWTPALGITALVEAVLYRERDPSSGGRFSIEEGAGLNLTPLATAGITFARPLRGRVEVQAGARALRGDVSGARRAAALGQGAAVLNLLLGLEYDVVTTTPHRRRSARGAGPRR